MKIEPTGDELMAAELAQLRRALREAEAEYEGLGLFKVWQAVQGVEALVEDLTCDLEIAESLLSEGPGNDAA